MLFSPNVLEQFANVIYVILKRSHLENIFNRNNNLHQNIKFTKEEESNGKLVSVYTLMKRNNRNISVLLKRKPTKLTDTYTAALISKQVVWKVLFPPSSIEHNPLSPLKIT